MKDLNNCRILLVDDTKANIDLLVHALKNDYQLGVALNGPVALEYAKGHQLDLILLDILMPEMDGFEVCRRLKADANTVNVPIIFITALDAPENKTRGLALGAVDYITKPFDIAEVKARVKTHLSLRVAQEALKIQNIILEVKVKERTRDLQKTQKDLFIRMGVSAEWQDKRMIGHLHRMAEYAKLLGKAAGFSENEIETLALAITVHDVGKTAVPDIILYKPKKLSPQEFEVVKTHTTIGAGFLSGSKSKLLRTAEIIARSHHEKWDGTGYPEGLSGNDIPRFGRLACICDVFDALISDLPYKEAWSVDAALDEIRTGAGSHFDPELSRLFVGLVPELVKIVGGHA